jgi:hypothetical protein
VQHADDDHGVRERAVIDGIGAMERDAEAGGKLLARGCGKGEIPYRLKGGFD